MCLLILGALHLKAAPFSFFLAGTFDALGGVLQPINAGGQTNNISSSVSNNSANNNHQTTPANGLITGDLESSLASLAENLTINSRTTVK